MGTRWGHLHPDLWSSLFCRERFLPNVIRFALSTHGVHGFIDASQLTQSDHVIHQTPRRSQTPDVP
jgi:hypothetical protein